MIWRLYRPEVLTIDQHNLRLNNSFIAYIYNVDKCITDITKGATGVFTPEYAKGTLRYGATITHELIFTRPEFFEVDMYYIMGWVENNLGI